MNEHGSMSEARAFWAELFGRDAPVEIEIGSGDGAFLSAYGSRFPERSLLGIERSPAKARRLAERLARLGLPNVRSLHADASCVVGSVIPPASVAAYHVYFPDPWPKRGHAARRIFTARFVTGLARTLVPGGRVYFATDVAGYADVARGHLLGTGHLREVPWHGDHPGLTTSFARKYRAGGRTLLGLVFERAIPTAQALAASKIRSM